MKRITKDVSREKEADFIGLHAPADAPSDPIFIRMRAGLKARKLVREKEG